MSDVVALKASPMAIGSQDRFEEATKAIRKRVPVKRDEWDDLNSREREEAFTVSDVTEMRVLQQVLDGVDRAIEDGTTLDEFRDDVAEDLIESWGGGEIPGRIETVFRTNIIQSYAEGRHAINSSPVVKAARPYWRYDEVSDDRECDECAECSGVVLPADDPWWNSHHPPLHYNCRCTVTALSPDEAEEEGVDDEGPDAEADDGFGEEPSAEGKDWELDLSGLDPDLRAALEERMAR